VDVTDKPDSQDFVLWDPHQANLLSWERVRATGEARGTPLGPSRYREDGVVRALLSRRNCAVGGERDVDDTCGGREAADPGAPPPEGGRRVAGNHSSGLAAALARGGPCERGSQSPRWVRIFSMTSARSMKASIRIPPPHRGQTSGSTSYTCLVRCAHSRFTSIEGTSTGSAAAGASPSVFRRFPRLTVLYRP
jgi:hypothetical protein